MAKSSWGWKTWFGLALLVATLVMTVAAFIWPKQLGENLNYITFISHLAIVLTALDIIWTSRTNEKVTEQ